MAKDVIEFLDHNDKFVAVLTKHPQYLQVGTMEVRTNEEISNICSKLLARDAKFIKKVFPNHVNGFLHPSSGLDIEIIVYHLMCFVLYKRFDAPTQIRYTIRK